MLILKKKEDKLVQKESELIELLNSYLQQIFKNQLFRRTSKLSEHSSRLKFPITPNLIFYLLMKLLYGIFC